MKTKQPSWHCVANLGDAHPFEYGGDFVLVDKRGIYDPELWHYDADEKLWLHVMLTICHEIKGSMVVQVGDNRYHPDSVAWFSLDDRLRSCAETCGMSVYQLKNLLCSSCPIERAEGYLALTANYGFSEFDQYPSKEAGTKKIISRFLAQVEQSYKWKDGIGL